LETALEHANADNAETQVHKVKHEGCILSLKKGIWFLNLETDLGHANAANAETQVHIEQHKSCILSP
jgi:hypothetical protein